MALTTVILKNIFIFHFSQLSLTLFVQNSFVVLFCWGGYIIVKKVISEQYTSAVLKIYVFL